METLELNKTIKDILDEVSDPEIPVLTVLDMGIIKDVQIEGKSVHLKITPTYSGCPAMDTIAADLKSAFKRHDMDAQIDLVLSPAWTTDWISENGKRKLEEYGIAAPLDEETDKLALIGEPNSVKCVRCGSKNTKLVSAFGSTACKALFQCNECLEPFDYFKCLK